MRIATFTLSGSAHDRRKQFRVRRAEHLAANPSARFKRIGSRVDVSIVMPSGKKKRAKQ